MGVNKARVDMSSLYGHMNVNKGLKAIHIVIHDSKHLCYIYIYVIYIYDCVYMAYAVHSYIIK